MFSDISGLEMYYTESVILDENGNRKGYDMGYDIAGKTEKER